MNYVEHDPPIITPERLAKMGEASNSVAISEKAPTSLALAKELGTMKDADKDTVIMAQAGLIEFLAGAVHALKAKLPDREKMLGLAMEKDAEIARLRAELEAAGRANVLKVSVDSDEIVRSIHATCAHYGIQIPQPVPSPTNALFRAFSSEPSQEPTFGAAGWMAPH